MPLTDFEIGTIAAWQPIREGFGRDDERTRIRINGILDRINATDDFCCKLVDEDNLSNYFTLFAFPGRYKGASSSSGQVDGLLIYLSACGPIGVVGHSRKILGRGFSAHDPLEIETLVDPGTLHCALEESVFNAIRSGGYEVLSPEEVSRPLPPGVKPDEYCYSSEPWDRVFHALFGNTD